MLYFVVFVLGIISGLIVSFMVEENRKIQRLKGPKTYTLDEAESILGLTAQPDIIYCKDCKYCDRGIDEDGNSFLKCLGWVYGGTQEKDSCNHAERRSDE